MFTAHANNLDHHTILLAHAKLKYNKFNSGVSTEEFKKNKTIFTIAYLDGQVLQITFNDTAEN